VPDLESAIINSALWAAAGDALGWMAELTDEAGLRRRIGVDKISHPVSWRRKIGGMSGTSVQLPAGTYSDDTQLRLAVCRSIRGDGTFDVEAFSKIELPVWLSYSLGAGRGTKAAATNFVRRDVAWYSNFFTGANGYVGSGGNGAAMRIQPHVWQCAGGNKQGYLGNVVRDAVITHGHMRGILGAVFHADCVAFALREGKAPPPAQWEKFIDGFYAVRKVIDSDPQLSRFWLSSWEAASETRLAAAIKETSDEALFLARRISSMFEASPTASYGEVLDLLDMRSDERRGAGLHSALASAAAAWIHRQESVEFALQDVANEIGSDTDTVATMVGAILGGLTDRTPNWPIQDKSYIVEQARRLAKIARGIPVQNFAYPDLFAWQPPSTQSDAVGKLGDGLAVAGLGKGKPYGEQWKSGGFVWQWIELSYGQTILCKMKAELGGTISAHNLPVQEGRIQGKVNRPPVGEGHYQEKFVLDEGKGARAAEQEAMRNNSALGRPAEQSVQRLEGRTLDEITDEAIRSNFDPQVVGKCLLEVVDSPKGIERALAFSSIVAKAFLVRNHRGGKR
jgi:ADP-ribosylglycohydrolase